MNTIFKLKYNIHNNSELKNLKYKKYYAIQNIALNENILGYLTITTIHDASSIKTRNHTKFK